MTEDINESENANTRGSDKMALTCEEYLEQIKKIETLIKNKMIEKGKLHQQTLDVALSITPGGEVIRKKNKKTGEVEWEDVHGVERVQSSSGGQPFANAVIDNVDTYNRLDAEIKKLESCKKEIISSIERLPEAEYDVLYMIYARYLTITEAATEKNCSESTIRRCRKRGIEILEQIKCGKFCRYVK